MRIAIHAPMSVLQTPRILKPPSSAWNARAGHLTMKCAKCGAENREGAKFCNECAAPIEASCPKCGSGNKSGAKFCDECGTSLGASAAASQKGPRNGSVRITERASAENIEGERKTVTMLFADIKGSMDLMEDLDPEEARAIVDPALKLMMEAVQRYGGYVAQSTGDGIFALFGAPLAHEDHPQCALYAARRMQEELKRYSDRIRIEGRLPIQARVGVNTGEVVVRSIATGEGRTEYAPVGHSTGVAARMQALAPVGSIAATERTQKLCEGYFVFKSLGPTKVKGVSEPVTVYEVTGLGPLRTRLQRGAARGYSKFVGRQREIETLKQAAEMAKAGHGQIVAAVAEPGVGKSRLFFEFKAGHQSDWMVLEAFSVSHGKASAYGPVIDLLNGYFAIEAGDDARKRQEKVTGKLLTLDRSLEDGMSYLFGLLSIAEGEDPLARIDPPVRKRRTLEAIKRMLLHESLNQPLMIIFEDLHWIDGETQAFLDLLADSIASSKILLLVNYRPEYSHTWSGKTYYAQLRLDPLGQENADEMLAALLGHDRALDPVRRLILGRAEGNPFFIEEIFQTLFEEGVLARNGTIRLAKPSSEVKVPATVQGVLASRIDRLRGDEKDLLQVLSVIGRQFPLALVRAVWQRSHVEKESDLERMLAALQLAEFIYEQPTVGDMEYSFKHALTQEVTYNSLLSDRRKSLHEQVAMSIEASFSTNLADHYDELANQFRRSGNAGKALEYLVHAGQQAMARTAFAQAQDQFGAGLTLLTTLPETTQRDRTESLVRLNLGICTIFVDVGAFMGSAVLSSLERSHELCEKLGRDSHHCNVLSALAFLYGQRSEWEKTQAACDELLQLASELNDPDMIGRAHFWSAFIPAFRGNFRSALDALDRAYKLPISFRSRQELNFGGWQTLTRSLSALALAIVGYPEKARLRNNEAMRLVRDEKERSHLPPILFWSTVLHLLLREPAMAYRSMEESLRVQSEENLAAIVSVSEFFLGRALVQLGEVDRGLDQMVRHPRETARFAQGPVGALIYPTLAEAYLAAGRVDEGIQAVSRGIAILGQNQARFAEPELHRLNGELMLLAGNVSGEPENLFRRAIEIARGQGAKWYELRATNGLARLLRDANRRDEARKLLSEIYNWFTEGFDTADLKDAKALLEELSA
jgi:class 3 adenylate cyclase/tetratricopeptide (TPR) repeat protein